MSKSKNLAIGIASVFLFAFMLGYGPLTATAQPFSLFTSGDLTTGSRGQAVVNLQGILAEMGYLSITSNTQLGYFGTMTKSALARYQTALGVPSTGYFGPMTRSAIFSQFSSNRWISASGDLTIGSTVASASGSGAMASGGTVLGTSTTNYDDAQRAPVTSTGYWSNDSWYSSVPSAASSTELGLHGYWLNGTWQGTSNDSGSSAGTTTSNVTSGMPGTTGSGTTGNTVGYWYNGTWYPAANTTGGGYFSPNPNQTSGNMSSNTSSMGSTNTMTSGTGQTSTQVTY